MWSGYVACKHQRQMSLFKGNWSRLGSGVAVRTAAYRCTSTFGFPKAVLQTLNYSILGNPTTILVNCVSEPSLEVCGLWSGQGIYPQTPFPHWSRVAPWNVINSSVLSPPTRPAPPQLHTPILHTCEFQEGFYGPYYEEITKDPKQELRGLGW